MTREQTLRDEIAEAMGWEYVEATNGEPFSHREDFAHWVRDGQRLGLGTHPIPTFSDDAALGFALRKIREAGWGWAKNYHTETSMMWRATGKERPPGECPRRDYAEVIATSNDTLDAMELLLKVLRHGKDKP